TSARSWSDMEAKRSENCWPALYDGKLFSLLEQAVQGGFALRPHHADGALLRRQPDRVGFLDDATPLVREVQAAAASASRRVHDDEVESEQPFKVPRERRLLDVQRESDLDRCDSVLLGQLGEQCELTGRDTQRSHGVVIDAGDDPAQLADTSGDAV